MIDVLAGERGDRIPMQIKERRSQTLILSTPGVHTVAPLTSRSTRP
jgi:hypothetical protein